MISIIEVDDLLGYESFNGMGSVLFDWVTSLCAQRLGYTKHLLVDHFYISNETEMDGGINELTVEFYRQGCLTAPTGIRSEHSTLALQLVIERSKANLHGELIRGTIIMKGDELPVSALKQELMLFKLSRS